MLFSDIEGSTVLLSRLGHRYGEVLSAQRAMLRAAISDRRGHEMGTEGDSFFVVFESAADAVACCVAAQRALGGHDWPGGATVRVRMGLHSGEPSRHEDGYVGMDLHRAARIAATAHGGQVVMSGATWQLAQPRLSAELSVRDLGFHRLKDIDEPEHLCQLAGPGLAERFAPLKSLGASTNLPVPATPLVGREDDLEHLRALADQPGIRLVTLTGPGGVGKTRLAVDGAVSLDSTFPHGIYFIALAAVRDADVMWKAIASDLSVDGDDPAAVLEHLRDRRTLLVLDNLEQLPGAAEVISALLAAAPRLVVLATSRGPLHLQGEHELPVPPLEIPREPAIGEVTASSAVRLFVQQVGMIRPGFAVTAANAADIAAICRRLDGLPLAIELAASRARLLSPKALLARLDHSLALAAADAGRPSRQQTLRATIAWSYDLLAPRPAAVLRRAGVFAGGGDLDALAAVALSGDGAAGPADPLELVTELMDVSLITVTEGADGEPRVGLLETIREFALERLAEAGELDSARRRHAGHYAALAERAHEQLYGPAQLGMLDRLEAEHDNLRAALTWSLEPQAAGDAERVAIGLRLVEALVAFWHQHGHGTEGRRWLQRAIELVNEDRGAPLATVAHGLGMLLTQQSEFAAAIPLFERSLAIYRDSGDRSQEAKELNSLGITYGYLGNLSTARCLLEESAALSREIGSDRRLAAALTNLGLVETIAGDLDRATHVLTEAVTLDQEQGDLLGLVMDQHALVMVGLRAGRAPQARDLLSSTLDYVISAGNSDILSTTLELAACAVAELGEPLRAASLAGAAETVRQVADMPLAEQDAVLLERFLGPARATMTRAEWDAEYGAGRALSQDQMTTLLLTIKELPHRGMVGPRNGVARVAVARGLARQRYPDIGRACAPHQVTGEHDPHSQGASSQERYGYNHSRRGRIVVGGADGHRTGAADPPHAARAVLPPGIRGLFHDLAHRIPALDRLRSGGGDPGPGDPQHRGPARRNHRDHRCPPAPPTARPEITIRSGPRPLCRWPSGTIPSPGSDSPPAANPSRSRNRRPRPGAAASRCCRRLPE
jgi:predicted ATPase